MSNHFEPAKAGESVPVGRLPEEKQLLQLVAKGDALAFDQLFRHYHPVIYTVARRISGQESVAQDICQDTFLKAWLSREGLESLECFRAWLYRVAANLSYDFLRKQALEERHSPAVAETLSESGAFTPTETLLESREYKRIIYDAVSTLSARQQQTFNLISSQGLSRKEAAMQMGIGAESVKSHYEAAVHKIRAYCITRLGLFAFALMTFVFF